MMNTEPLLREYLQPSHMLEQQKGVHKKYLQASQGSLGLLAGTAAGQRWFAWLSGTQHLAAEIL